MNDSTVNVMLTLEEHCSFNHCTAFSRISLGSSNIISGEKRWRKFNFVKVWLDLLLLVIVTK